MEIKLSRDVENVVKELYFKAQEIDLGNVRFEHYDSEIGDIDLILTEYKNYWELAVVNERKVLNRGYKRITDFYKIDPAGKLVYENTEMESI